ncbi:hypothetical protein RQP46_008043 [Phenoliferia psychrophenolica]
MATFASLPPELVQVVLDDLSRLPTNYGGAALWSATLVSRAWYQIAQPMLYQHITLGSTGRHANRWIRSPARLRHPPTSLMLYDIEGLEELTEIFLDGDDELEDDEGPGGVEESGSRFDEEESGAGEDNGEGDNDTDVPELPPLPDLLGYTACSEPVLPFHLDTLVLHVSRFDFNIPYSFFDAILATSSTTLRTLELRNKKRGHARFFDTISPSFHLVAANLFHLFLPVHEPRLHQLLILCTSLTSLTVPAGSTHRDGTLLGILDHLPTTPTLTHLAVYDFLYRGTKDRPSEMTTDECYTDLLLSLQRLPALANLVRLSITNIGENALERWEVEQPALFKECTERSLEVSE